MTALAVARDLFVALDRQGMRYCHWKSNEHVAAGLSGHTDLDILIDRRQAAGALEVLGRCGFKRFEASVGTGYPAIEDHIALDRDTGMFLHCHLHYRLVAGERRFKGYRLPWEDLLLERRVWDADHGLYVADPSFEILILIVRFAVKIRARDVLRHAAARSYLRRKGFLAEYEWLRPQIDRQESLCLCTELLGERASLALAPILDGSPSLSGLRRFRHAARAELETLRSYGRLAGTALQWVRTLTRVAAGVSRRYLRLPVPLRRTLPTGGVVVALMGCNGSDKSSLPRELTRIFRAKVDVFEVSLGSGDGPTSRLDRSHRPLRKAGLMAFGDIARGLVLAREKRRRLRAAWRARNLGMVVIADRYPQAQARGFDDGPLLSDYADHNSKFLRWLARREAVPYAWADQHPPDLVIRLNVSPPNSVARNEEMTLDETERRVNAVRSLTYPPGTCVVDIDADRPLSEVIHEVKWAVWNQL